ncbi:hypothetical protein ACN2XU_02080 [Primorskyibacter sp. 2E107]|uniref:hypothetical protein n=1 Tax=Primorskyibacter sp. 2E107 TaxID=3403458 RepID=UPI003AF9187F
MRILGTLGLAAGLAMTAGAAFAWGDMYMGDATNDPNSNFLMHSYPAENLCPAGLQPVTMGGVICCGSPNAGPYINRAGKAKYTAQPKRKAPTAYAPAGEKGVIYR